MKEIDVQILHLQKKYYYRYMFGKHSSVQIYSQEDTPSMQLKIEGKIVYLG